jgi:integrase
VHVTKPQRARLGITPYRDRKRPHLKWTVKGHFVENRRTRVFFKTKAEAEGFVSQLQIKAENLGTQATQIDPKLHFMAIEAHDMLAPLGKTIMDAATFYRQHIESIERSCTVDELISALLQRKEADGKRDRYLKDLRNRLAHFSKQFGSRVIATISSNECDDWLRAFKLSAQSRNNYRAVLSVLFSYAESRGYCSVNPVTKTGKAKVADKPVEVLTPEQTRRLLANAEPDMVPYIAIGAFAGLRAAELERLSWQEVRLDRNFIEVSAAKSKTARRRLVTIQPNLKMWLEPLARMAGFVTPPNPRVKLDLSRKRAGIKRWPANGLRHSFASYHLAHFKDAPATALQLGHSTTAMLFGHYREVVTPESASRYWLLLPGN